MAATLAIEIVGDAADAASALDSVGDAAERMADRVDAATRDADGAASRLSGVGDAADTLDDKAGRATGALGALSAGFELVGAEKYAGALQGAAMATDFFSGVGQAATLVMESGGLAAAKAKVAVVAKSIAEKAAAAATKALAIAQRVLNAAMRANPIGLVVTALGFLVAGIVLAYKRSERFRAIVQAVMRGARTAVGWVVDKIGDLVGWFRDKAPAAANRLREVAVRAFLLITTPQRKVIELVGKVVDWFRDKIPGAAATLREKAVAAWDKVKSGVDKLLDPVRKVRDTIQDLVGWIKKIDFPSPPDWLDKVVPGKVFGRTTTTGGGGMVAGGNTFVITVNGAVDPDSTARQIEQLVARRSMRLGGTLRTVRP